MFEKFLKKKAKEYVLKRVNDILIKDKDNTATVCEKINYWTVRLNLIVELLKTLSSRCSDGQLTDEEAQKTIDEIRIIVKNF